MYTFSNIHRTYNKYFSRNTNQGEIHLAKVIIHTFLKTMIWPNLLYCKGKWNKYQHFFFGLEGIWFWSLNIFVGFHWNPLSSSWVSLIVFFFSIKVALVFIFKILYKMRTEAFFVYFKRWSFFPALTRSALRAPGLLLADSVPTVRWGKTFWRIFGTPKIAKNTHFGRFWGTENGTWGAQIKILRPPFNTNTPQKNSTL